MFDIFWNEAIKQLKEENIISEQEYSMWFSNLSYFESEESAIILNAPSKFFADQIVIRYKKMLTDKIFELAGINIDIKFNIVPKTENTKKVIETREVKEKSEANNNNTSPKKTINQTNNNSSHPQLNSMYTFDNYVIGDNNEFSTNAGKAIVNDPGKQYNPCLIYGGVGLGKTHLMQAIGNAIYQKYPDYKIIYTPAEAFVNEFISSISSGTTAKFKNKYRHVDVLLIDDIHDFHSKESSQEELFHTFNALYDANKQLVFTCDRPPSELQKFSDRLRSRFERGLNLDLQPPNYETRMAILKNKLINRNTESENNFEITDDILNYIAKNVTTNVRDLEAALTRLLAYADLVGKNITMEIAQNQLKNIFQKPVQANITIDKVQKVVAEYFNVSTQDLKSKKRTKLVTFPRQIAMYIIREITDFSTTEIGLEFGGRDHTTVMHSCQKIEEQIVANPTLEPTIHNMMRTIRESSGK